ncbi:MAG: sulfite exporter TauE/SafE family protein [Gemmatimonadota bacterium]
MTAFLLTALLAGLAGSPHCVAMCGGFASACAVPRSGFAAWHAGRLAAYATLGAIAGAVGRAIPGPAWLPALLAALFLVWFAGALAGLVPEPKLPFAGLTRLAQRWLGRPGLLAQFGFGVVNGFLPCGLVYSALAIPVALGHPGQGALAMLAFGAGTIPLLSAAALWLRRFTARSLAHRRLLALAILLLGLLAIAMRAGVPSVSSGMGHGPAHTMAD